MTTLILSCPVCGSSDLKYLGIEEGNTDTGYGFADVYACENCNRAFQRSELDEEWDSSFDIDDDDDISGNFYLTEISGGWD